MIAWVNRTGLLLTAGAAAAAGQAADSAGTTASPPVSWPAVAVVAFNLVLLCAWVVFRRPEREAPETAPEQRTADTDATEP